jgi:hypothetical protein
MLAPIFIGLFLQNRGHAVAQLIKALRYNPEDCGFDSSMMSFNFLCT